jgi:hypothetical protein
MNSKSKGSAANAVTVIAKDPAQQPGNLKIIGGSQSDAWNNLIANDTMRALWLKNSDEKTRDQQFSAAVAGLVGIAPNDELEGMMAAQLIAAHSASMECYRRAMIGDQSLEGRRENLTQANKLSRTFTELLEALNRHRGKGQQKVTVEHIHVHPGGQAVVGVVQPPGEGIARNQRNNPMQGKLPMQLSPKMRSPDESREPVQIAGDVERSLPIARRIVAGSTEGKLECLQARTLYG